ncbi:S24 family peptidase [Ferrovum myxofaciens]|uniref:S24 family peptidase n=1 Tax=Ferrovum myxofaciens TaxID=416213 RepID=UPI0004E26DB7|nr:S24 family peptidase [Ferrovum myxofaciens]MBU6993539.1 helix-turn-helix transcriptional regulator [Ferrovum myxofaciens]QKE40036.1 MAG: helix-turn-helix transcriptional regulator [Ferrovum myxofaciens]
MDKYESRRLRLIELRDTRCNGKAVELARKLGREPSYVSRMIYPEGKAGKKRIADEMVDVIEQAFNLPHGWLDITRLSVAEPATSYPKIHNFDEPAVKSACFAGIVHGDESGYIEDSEPPGFVWPSGKQRYTLKVRGDFLAPRIKSGEYLVIHPENQPIPGDDVLVFLKDCRKMIKEFLYIRDSEVSLGSINNNQKNVCVPLDQIEKMHQIVAVVSRGGEFQE